MAEAIQELETEIRTIKKEVAYLKEHMVDVDSIMTEDDFEALVEYRKEKKAGKLAPHEQLKKELDSGF